MNLEVYLFITGLIFGTGIGAAVMCLYFIAKEDLS